MRTGLGLAFDDSRRSNAHKAWIRSDAMQAETSNRSYCGDRPSCVGSEALTGLAPGCLWDIFSLFRNRL